MPRLLLSLLAAACLRAHGLRTASHLAGVEDGRTPAEEAFDDYDLFTDLNVYRESEPRQAYRGKEVPLTGLDKDLVDEDRYPGPRKYLFFTHHKTGTFLMRQLALALNKTLAMEVKLHIENRKTHPCNFTAEVAHYQNMHENDLEVLRRDCPNYRAVHLIRSPLSLLASAYMYHRNVHDCFGMPTGPKKLEGKSVYDGLRMEAQAITFPIPGMRGVLREMLAVHDLVKDDPRVFETDLAAFEADFDGAAKRVFTHLLGPGHSVVNKLVAVSKAADVSKWAPERLAKNDHVHQQKMKHTVTKAIAELIRVSDAATLEVQSYSEPLGYDSNATML